MEFTFGEKDLINTITIEKGKINKEVKWIANIEALIIVVLGLILTCIFTQYILIIRELTVFFTILAFILFIIRRGSITHERLHECRAKEYGIEGKIKTFNRLKLGGIFICNSNNYAYVEDFQHILIAPFKAFYVSDCAKCLLIILIHLGYYTIFLHFPITITIIVCYSIMFVLICIILCTGYISDLVTYKLLNNYKGKKIYMESKHINDLMNQKEMSLKIKYEIFD